MEPKYPHYIPPRLCSTPTLFKYYETEARCKETDHICSVEYGGECDIYYEFLVDEAEGKGE